MCWEKTSVLLTASTAVHFTPQLNNSLQKAWFDFTVVLDYDDYQKIPYFKAHIDELNNGRIRRLRSKANGEVAEEDLYFPLVFLKIPGRFYFLFGKPIETEEELKDRGKANELYLHVKSEVVRNMAYLKEKREKDPYMSLLSRLAYQASNGFTSDVPTFEL